MPRTYYVYILANRSRTLYVGVTNDIARRVAQHRIGHGSRFTRRYAIHRLVFVETTARVRDAIAREKQIKRWVTLEATDVDRRTQSDVDGPG